MVGHRPRVLTRLHLQLGTVDALLAALGLLLLGAMVLLTPAFTDYEAESEPAIRALIDGHLQHGLELLPIYAGSVLVAAPFGALAQSLGGGDLAVYRAVAVPGAVGVAILASLAGRWLREAERPRIEQLAVVGAIALSPCVALAWKFGHFEEPLVAAAALSGLLLAVSDRRHGALLGGGLLGLAIAGKLWAVVLLPVALVGAKDRRAALQIATAAGAAGALLLAPYAVSRFADLTGVASDGSGGIFSKGNAWWFFGAPNPAYQPDALVVRAFTTDNSARIPPTLVSDHARGLIVLVAIALSAAWGWRHRLRTDEAAASEARLASLLWLAASVLWWRALLDPWFQPYYLAAALIAVCLAEARSGRLPRVGLVAWAALWLLHGPSVSDFGLSADGASAVSLAWMLPFGLFVTYRALRTTREHTGLDSL